MIATLAGMLRLREAGRLVIEAGGIGYEIFIPLSTYYRVPSAGTYIRLEIRQVVRIPKPCQLGNRIGVGNLWSIHRFFHWLNRRCSCRVMGRAVTGKPLPSGNWITTQKRYRPAAVWPRT